MSNLNKDNRTRPNPSEGMINALYRHSRENGNPERIQLDSCSSIPSKNLTGRNDKKTGDTPLEPGENIDADKAPISPLTYRVLNRRASDGFLTGFTLIELMVVVVIIGILAAIAIPNYIAMKNRANQASVEAAIHTIQLTLENYAIDTGGVYPSTPNLSDQNFVNLLPNKQMPQNPYTFVSIQSTSASGYQSDPSSWALIHSGCSGTATAGQITYYFSPSTAPTAWSMNGCNSSGAITLNPTYENFVVHN